MPPSFYKLLSLSAVAVMLIGCLATTDLVRDVNGYSDGYKTLIQLVAAKAGNTCTTGRYRENSGKKTMYGGMPITHDVEVRKVYASNTDWYKLQVLTRSVFDHVYYNRSTLQLECGDVNWQGNRDLAAIIFNELTPGSPEALENPAARAPH